MEIKNVVLFFIGIIILILGSFIVIFDYPQIQFLNNIDLQDYDLLDDERKSIHQRLIIEFYVGIVILSLGVLLLIFSTLNRFKNSLRQ